MEESEILQPLLACSFAPGRESYHLAIPSFINSSEMFSCLLDQRQNYQTEKLVGYSGFYNIFDALH